MYKTLLWIPVIGAIIFVLSPHSAFAQTVTVTCSSSNDGQRQHCVADTSAGVVLQRSTGTAECLLGKTCVAPAGAEALAAVVVPVVAVAVVPVVAVAVAAEGGNELFKQPV